ncbi:RES family NAD+ phosphorylase [Alloacidobacterium sp.]|uniref:RES family NAD+ phosphorylase n=1 Tax=Alloacidobacterium sp. TaxID=2951999 RepID=UPI002D557ABD|nr:RES family NAD+ phosphorylase [Alloacidobacterium sp.]HYK38007.1 RES family NAD+ phosphorylase [Alloacidobacterium sp.]
MKLPPVTDFFADGMHRLIPSRYSKRQTVLADVADNDAMLDDITLLDGATNERIQTEQAGKIGISTYELVYGIPNAHIVNAAFSYSAAPGGRFNDETRGAWYAADELDTSLAEVTYHKARRLGEMVVPGLPGDRPDRDVSTYDDWRADFRSPFHTLDSAAEWANCLEAGPLPGCYAAPQRLARALIAAGSNGLVYPSVRRAGHTCLVCFRPALVYRPRRDIRLEIVFEAAEVGYEWRARTVGIQ